MSLSITHTTTATGTDAGNGSIHKAQWNEAHTLTGTASTLLGFTSGGASTTYSLGTNLEFNAGALRVTDAFQVSSLATISNSSYVNYIQVTGGTTGNYPKINANGTDPNIPLLFSSKNTGDLFFVSPGGSLAFYTSIGAAMVVNPQGYIGLRSAAQDGTLFFSNGTLTDINSRGLALGVTLGVPLTYNAVYSYPTISSSGVDTVHFLAQSSGGAYNDIGFYAYGMSGSNIAYGFCSYISAGANKYAVYSFSTADSFLSGTTYIGGDAPSGASLKVLYAASQVNWIEIAGGTTGNSATISAKGTGSNLDLPLVPKGTGYVKYGTHTGTALTISGYIEIKDAAGTVRKLAVVT